jgi:hypothetical protein
VQDAVLLGESAAARHSADCVPFGDDQVFADLNRFDRIRTAARVFEQLPKAGDTGEAP